LTSLIRGFHGGGEPAVGLGPDVEHHAEPGAAGDLQLPQPGTHDGPLGLRGLHRGLGPLLGDGQIVLTTSLPPLAHKGVAVGGQITHELAKDRSRVEPEVAIGEGHLAHRDPESPLGGAVHGRRESTFLRSRDVEYHRKLGAGHHQRPVPGAQDGFLLGKTGGVEGRQAGSSRAQDGCREADQGYHFTERHSRSSSSDSGIFARKGMVMGGSVGDVSFGKQWVSRTP